MRSSIHSHTISSMARSRPCRTTAILQSYEKQEKEKKVLSDMRDIKHALKALHSDATQQLKLEIESQQTFEFLAEQLRVVRSSLLTLTDVFEDEFTSLKQYYQTELHDQSAQMIKMDQKIHELSNENQSLKEKIEDLTQSYESRWSKLKVPELEIITDEKVPKMEQKIKQIVTAIRQQAEEIHATNEKLAIHSDTLAELDLQQHAGLNSHDKIVADLEVKITKLYEKTNELIRQNSSSLKADILHISQEVKTQASTTTKLQGRMTQIEYSLQKALSDKGEGDLSLEDISFHLKKLQVTCDGLKERYDLIMKESRAENSALQSSINDLGGKISSVRQYSERVGSELTNLNKSVQKKTTSLSNAINVLVEMLDQRGNEPATNITVRDSIPFSSSSSYNK